MEFEAKHLDVRNWARKRWQDLCNGSFLRYVAGRTGATLDVYHLSSYVESSLKGVRTIVPPAVHCVTVTLTERTFSLETACPLLAQQTISSEPTQLQYLF